VWRWPLSYWIREIFPRLEGEEVVASTTPSKVKGGVAFRLLGSELAPSHLTRPGTSSNVWVVEFADPLRAFSAICNASCAYEIGVRLLIRVRRCSHTEERGFLAGGSTEVEDLRLLIGSEEVMCNETVQMESERFVGPGRRSFREFGGRRSAGYRMESAVISSGSPEGPRFR
jgi:hypothetical protein